MSADSEKDDEFEVLDLDKSKTWIKRFVGDLQHASVAKQITVGGIGGWFSGYAFAKIGKATAAAVGGSLLLIQYANHNGYININWTKIKQKVTQTKRTLRKDVERSGPAVAQQSMDFVKANMWMTGGFVGGFLLGLSS